MVGLQDIMNRILPLAGLLLLASACDLAIRPATADGLGVRAARLAIVLGSELGEPPDAVTAVEVEVFDLRVHRPSDDAWIMLTPDVVRVDIVAQDDTLTHDGIPLRPDLYDEVQLVIGGVRIAHGDTWTDAELLEDELALTVDWPVSGHATLEVRFDLAKALQGSAHTGWTFTPALSATLNHRG
jgi:hypothetical protein